MAGKSLKGDRPRVRWALVILASVTVFAAAAGAVAVAVAIGLQWFPPKVPYNPPQISALTFTRRDGAAAPIRLSGSYHRVLGELMFPDFRQVAPAPPKGAGAAVEENAATWEVMVRLTDGERFVFTAHDLPDGDVWTAAGVPRPVRGDIELLLAAREGIALLDLRTSPNFAAVEQAVAALGDEEIDALLRLRKSSNRVQRAVALMALNYIVSPRLRREQRMSAFVFNPADVADTRAAADHPRAAELRSAARAAFDEWNQGAASTPDWSRLEDALFESLDELADSNAADHLAAALRQRTPADYQAEDIMEALEHFYSLPPMVQPLHYCPTGETQESIARAEVLAQSRREDRRKLLLAWHEAHRGQPRAAQLTAAMAKWEALVNGPDAYNLVAYPHYALRTFRPLLREGPAIRLELEAAQQRTAGPLQKGAWEMLIALATGTHDAALLDELAHSEPLEWELAGKICEVSSPR